MHGHLGGMIMDPIGARSGMTPRERPTTCYQRSTRLHEKQRSRKKESATTEFATESKRVLLIAVIDVKTSVHVGLENMEVGLGGWSNLLSGILS